MSGNMLEDMDFLDVHSELNTHDQLFEPEFATNFADTAVSNNGTVSPKDLMRDSVPSAPGSSALTNFTSPSIFDSPLDSYETSPMYGNGDDFLGTGENWFPLFDNSGEDSPPVKPEDLYLRQHARSKPSMDASPGHSPDQARGAGLRKHSSSNSVSKKKRNSLAPIVVQDPADSVAIKLLAIPWLPASPELGRSNVSRSLRSELKSSRARLSSGAARQVRVLSE